MQNKMKEEQKQEENSNINTLVTILKTYYNTNGLVNTNMITLECLIKFKHFLLRGPIKMRERLRNYRIYKVRFRLEDLFEY